MMKKAVVDWSVSVNIVTGSIARSAKRRYLSNSEERLILRFFAPQRRHVAPVGMKLSTDCKKLQPEMEICNQK